MRLLVASIVLMLLIVAISGYWARFNIESDAALIAATIAMLAIVASPLIIMLVNWLISPLERSENK